MSLLKVPFQAISRGDNNQLYLSRWIFYKGTQRKIYLHCFHQSDHADFHDHPWPYTSIIVWGGYYEVTPQGRKWYGPGSVIRRPSTWAHRVELYENKPVWTLFFPGKKEREWGFFCKSGWRHWTEADKALKDKGNVCG